MFKLYDIGRFYNSLPKPIITLIKKTRLHLLAKRVLVFIKYRFKRSVILANYYDLKISFKHDYTLELRNAYLPQIEDGIFQPQTVKVFETVIKKNDTIIDCGSNFGFFSLLACKLTGKNGKVFAFDASKQACDALLENATINNFTNLIVSNYALSDVSNKQYNFYGNEGGGTIIKDNPGYDTSKSSQKVLSVSLDDFFANKKIGKLKLIKIDVEGYEYFVFRGMKKLIKNNPQAIVTFELTKDAMKLAGYSIRDVLTELEEVGLDTLYNITNHDHIKQISTQGLLRDFEIEEIADKNNEAINLIELLAMNSEFSKSYKILG